MSREGATVALVTGGGRGIGRAVAAALAAGGHRVAVGYGQDRESAEKVAADIDGLALPLEVTDEDAIDAAFAAVEEAWGPVQTVVNNAGITDDGLAVRLSAERWRSVLSVNLDGAFLVTRRALPAMLRARHGRIVNVGSVAGLTGSAGQASYGAAKAGLVGLTRALARELAPRRITCNLVAPGPVETEMTAALDPARRDALVASVPLGRMGTADEVAAAVAYLCSPAAAYVTGAVLPVDGGLGMGH